MVMRTLGAAALAHACFGATRQGGALAMSRQWADCSALPTATASAERPLASLSQQSPRNRA
eukprot:648959-Pyramimonas_sp.AAC.1